MRGWYWELGAGSRELVDAMDASARVGVVLEGERVCVACGYALVGLPMYGVCPECGVAVERSLGERLLHDVDAGYLRELARGAGCVVWGVWLSVALAGCLIGPIVLDILFAAPGFGLPSNSIVDARRFGVPILVLAAAVVSAIGWWKITTTDAGAPASDRGAVIRKRARWLFVVGAALLMMIVLLEMSNLSGVSLFGQMVPWMVLGLMGLLALVMLLWFQASMRVVRGLADRVPDRTLRARAGRCAAWAWVVAGWFMILVVSIVLIAMFASSASASSSMAFGLVIYWGFGVMLGFALLLALFVMYAMMAARLRGACVRAQERGKQVARA